MENMKVSACVQLNGGEWCLCFGGELETKTERGVYVHGITRPYGTLDEI